jgi:hypothetical protein
MRTRIEENDSQDGYLGARVPHRSSAAGSHLAQTVSGEEAIAQCVEQE